MGDRLLDQKNDLLEAPLRETPVDLLACAGRAAAYSMVQSPLDGAAQLLDKTTGSKFLPSLHLMDAPSETQFASAKWHAQQIGSAAGMALPFLILHKGVSNFSRSALELTLGGASARHLGKSAGKSIIDSALTGAAYGGIFTPVSSDDDFYKARWKESAIGAATFATFTGASSALKGFDRVSPKANLKEIQSFKNAVIAGLPAGAVCAEGRSLAESGKHADAIDLLKSAYSFSFVGGALSLGQLSLDSLSSRRLRTKALTSEQTTQTDSETESELRQANSLLEKSEFLRDGKAKAKLIDIWLDGLPENTLDPKEQKAWSRLGRKFQSESSLNGISGLKQADALSQIERLLLAPRNTKSGGIDPARYKQVAREVMENITYPSKIDQGDHPTCVLNSIENILASNHPEKYARLVADLALSGKSFRNGEGIKLPDRCLSPDAEAKIAERRDGNRCFASQLTQYYLANLKWQGGGELPNMEEADPGSVIYQPLAKGGNRAGLYVDGKLLKVDGYDSKSGVSSKVPFESPNVLDYEIQGLFRKVAPRGKIQVIDHVDGIDRWTNESGRRSVDTVKNAKELERILKESTPNTIICGVRGERLGGEDGWHAVVLRSYNPTDRTVQLDNSWGKEEYNGRNRKRIRPTVEELFELMKPEAEENGESGGKRRS